MWATMHVGVCVYVSAFVQARVSTCACMTIRTCGNKKDVGTRKMCLQGWCVIYGDSCVC